MSEQDDMEQARAEHHRSRHSYYYDETRERDEAARAEAESEEAMEAHWQRSFAMQAREQTEQHWADRPGIDRRTFAVDGEVDEHRPEAPEYEIPWPA